MTEVSGEMVEAAARAIAKGQGWNLPNDMTLPYGEGSRIGKVIAEARTVLEIAAPLIAAQERERCAKKAQTELENWGIDLQGTSDAYREAAATGKFNGRRVTADFAKSQAARFKERADAIYDFGETVAARIRASKEG